MQQAGLNTTILPPTPAHPSLRSVIQGPVAGDLPSRHGAAPASRGRRFGRTLALALALAGLGLSANVASEPSATITHSAVSAPFSIQQEAGSAWLTRPDGGRFFSFGVCCVDQGTARDSLSPTNPAFASWQHYSNATHWANATLDRLTNWGITTVGGWSDYATLRPCPANVAFTPVLHMGSSAGAPWLDMWDPKVIGRMEEVARDQILAVRADPRLIGYYSDNEIGWWNADLLHLALKQPQTSGQRQRLIRLLREIYHGNWDELLRDFEPVGADSFQALQAGGVLYVRPGGNGFRTLRQFAALLADRYYSLVREIIRKHDPRALILGDRYQSFFYPEIARAAAPYLDVASSNLNAAWNDGTFPRYYFETLHQLTGKAILASEFYMSATDNRSGNKNSGGGFPVVATQAERAVGFRNTLSALAQNPWVVGADWFQYYDEPTHGRGDGEDFNFGFIDIHNQPYLELTHAAAALDLAALRKAPRLARASALQGVPRAPRHPLEPCARFLALKQWDRERGFVPPASELPMADAYLAWDESAIYLGLCAQDIVEGRAYRGDKVAPEDRAEWVVTIPGSRRPIRTRIGAGLPPTVDDSAVRIANFSGVYHQTKNFAALELPSRLFGRERFSAGERIALVSTFTGHGRVDHTEWRGEFTLSP